jgi:hypothetical protein
MTKTYMVRTKLVVIFGGLVLLLSACFWSVAASSIPILPWLVFALHCFCAFIWVTRHPYAVTVEDTDAVVIHYLWEDKRFSLRDLRGIRWRSAGDDDRELRVEFRESGVYLPEFDRDEILIADLRRLIRSDSPGAPSAWDVAVQTFHRSESVSTWDAATVATYELRYSRADVFEAPDINSNKLGELTRGHEFELSASSVQGPEHQFYRVRTSTGVEGFVFVGNIGMSA